MWSSVHHLVAAPELALLARDLVGIDGWLCSSNHIFVEPS